MSSNAVFVRDMGDLPISIGTSLPIQALYNAHPDKKPEKKLPVLKADVLYINVRTLLRNIMSSTESSKVTEVSPKDYLKALKEEIIDISIYINSSNVDIPTYYYLPSYDSLSKEFGSTAELREPRTDLQKSKLNLEKEVLGLLDSDLKKLPPEKRYVNKIDMEIKSKDRVKAFILTHYPVDLLYASGFSSILLLESHTGAIKGAKDWYTKFSAEASERIPFNKGTLTFFGDSGGMFKPQHHKARKAVMDVADKYKWTYNTTESKILLNLKIGGQGVIEQVMRKMLK